VVFGISGNTSLSLPSSPQYGVKVGGFLDPQAEYVHKVVQVCTYASTLGASVSQPRDYLLTRVINLSIPAPPQMETYPAPPCSQELFEQASAMEHPRKRPCVSQVMDKDTLDPDLDLQESRARNDLRLKSTFEAIFRKFEHDFTGIGDEIDFQTGEIVVNNGHIKGMRSEHDIGDRKKGPSEDLGASTTAIGEGLRFRETSSLLSDDFDTLSNCGHKEVKVCAHIGVQSVDDDVDSLLGSEQDPDVRTEQDPQMEDIWSTGDGLRDKTTVNNSAPHQELPSQQAILAQFGPTLGLQIADLASKMRNPNGAPVEEAWRVPDLPAPPPTQRPILKSLINTRRERSVSPLKQMSLWAPSRSIGRPKKDRSVALSKWTPTGNSSFTVRAEVPLPDNTQTNGSPSRHTPSRREKGLDLYPTKHFNTVGHHRNQPRSVSENASYTTPKSSPFDNPNTSRNSRGSSLKRKRLQQSTQRTKTLNEGGQSPKKQGIKQHITPGQITTHHCRADCRALASPHSNPSPLSQRKQLTYCARWTLQEEELLWHLKEKTDLAYNQLVEYFPGRTKGNIRAHYLLMAPSSTSKPENSKTLFRPLYTPAEDELLVELRSNKALPWKEIMTSFPTRTANALTQRYCRILQVTTPCTKQTTSAKSSSATSEDLLHIDSGNPSLGATPSEQKLPKEHTNTVCLHGEHVARSSPQRTEADPRALCKVTDTARPLFPSRLMEETPLRDRTSKLDPPPSEAFKVVIQTSTSKQRQQIAHEEGVTMVMATPDSDHRPQCQSKDISMERTPPLNENISGRSESSHVKISQSRDAKSTPTASGKHKTTKSRTSQAAGTRASLKAMTPRSQAALVSLLGDGTDDEDELSKSANVIGGSKDRPLEFPNRTVGQGCMGGKICDRRFCFKCM